MRSSSLQVVCHLLRIKIKLNIILSQGWAKVINEPIAIMIVKVILIVEKNDKKILDMFYSNLDIIMDILLSLLKSIKIFLNFF